MMRSLEIYELLFLSLLGRSLSSTEKQAIEERYGDSAINPESIAQEIIQSDEYYFRHRESFVQRQFPVPTVVLARGPLGHQIHCDLRQLHLGLSMACGHYEPDETAFIKNNVKRGMTVLDVGANVGYFTTMFAGLVGDAGKVIALEPVIDTYQKLRSSVALNGLDMIVEIHNVAASAENGTCQLSYDLASANMGGVSMRPTGTMSSHRIVQTASTMRIDDIVWGRPIDFIKIDIEGAEGLALAGAEQTFRRSRPIVIMEFNGPQLSAVSGMSTVELFGAITGFGYTGNRLLADGVISAVTEAQFGDMVGDGQIVNVVFSPK